MGITIHFQGYLKDWNLLDDTIQITEEYAKSNGWKYTRSVKGITVIPSENCDPLNLEFDENLHIDDFCKTQFAGMDIHIKILELLKKIRKNFNIMEIYDESEFLENGDKKLLKNKIAECFLVMEEYKRKNPNAHGPVKTPEGRMIDLENTKNK